jgi:hypothetical protein
MDVGQKRERSKIKFVNKIFTFHTLQFQNTTFIKRSYDVCATGLKAKLWKQCAGAWCHFAAWSIFMELL